MYLMKAIKTRRSVRRYKPDPVSDKLITKVLEAARWAPSWGNTQCWRFVVVKDPEMKVKIADACDPRNPAREAVRNAPVLIIACAKTGRAGIYRGEVATDKGDWFMFDTALAMQNLTLAAWSLGLGTVHNGLFDAKKVETLLGVPEGVRVVDLTPLGYPDGEPKATGRKELSEIVFKEKYGQS